MNRQTDHKTDVFGKLNKTKSPTIWSPNAVNIDQWCTEVAIPHFYPTQYKAVFWISCTMSQQAFSYSPLFCHWNVLMDNHNRHGTFMKYHSPG